MDDYDHLDLVEIDFAPLEGAAERLALFTLEEAHDVFRLLLLNFSGCVRVVTLGDLCGMPVLCGMRMVGA
ncbi:hypothetical protein QF037_009594 [Streptomyces canus]|uniref:DUF6417 family protein n=1 Tax=Streptomyces canus TaxID=58343 RepID=UPI002786B8B3|nr:DUF6417 family protein [Streptomyces canus]MDQ0605249.1 hypothetical protein [Streptomyces canus]